LHKRDFNFRTVSELESDYFNIEAYNTVHNSTVPSGNLSDKALFIRDTEFSMSGIIKYNPNPEISLGLKIFGIQRDSGDSIDLDLKDQLSCLKITSHDVREFDTNGVKRITCTKTQEYITTPTRRMIHEHKSDIIRSRDICKDNEICFQCPAGWVANTAQNGCEKLLCATSTSSSESMHKCFYKNGFNDDGESIDNAGFLNRYDGTQTTQNGITGVTLKDKCLGTDLTNPYNTNWPYYDISLSETRSRPMVKDIHGASCCEYVTNQPGLNIYSDNIDYDSHYCTHINDYLTRKTTLSLLPGNILEKEHYFGQEIHNGSTMWEDENNTKPFMDPISYDMIKGNVSKDGELINYFIESPTSGGKINRTICNYSDYTRLRTEEEIIYDGYRANARHKYVMVYEKVCDDTNKKLDERNKTDEREDLPYSFLNTSSTWKQGIIVYWKIDISPIIYKGAFNSRFRMYRATVEKLHNLIRYANDDTKTKYYKYAGSLLGEILGKLQDELYESRDPKVSNPRNRKVGRKLEWIHGSSKTLKREYQLLAENPIFDPISPQNTCVEDT
jgi:hypothetical protein